MDREILGASLKDDDTDSKLFKSLKFLISRAILANPKGAAATAIAYCELKSKDGEIPLHVVKELEVWAAKYTREGDAMEWHQILAALGLPNQPDIKQPRPGAATIDFQKPSHYGDPISVMELNVNGLAARWKQHEIDVPLQEVQLDDHDSSAVSKEIIALPRIFSHSCGPLPMSWLHNTTAASLCINLSSAPKSNKAISTVYSCSVL